MKLTMKLFLLVTLFCGTAMADGQMGSGGRSVQPNTTKTTTQMVVLISKYILTILT